MQILKNKKEGSIAITIQDASVLWVPEPVTTPSQIEALDSEGYDFVIFSIPEEARSVDEIRRWDVLSQNFKNKGTLLIFASGEYQVKNIHLRGSSLDSAVHYVLETPEGSIGLFNSTPSDSFVKQYAPIDVVIGKDTALTSAQLDFEPFYLVLVTMSEEYKKKSGVSEVQVTSKMNIKKMDSSLRESNVPTEVYSLE